MINKYSKYINTGTHWLTEIPEHWKLVGLKKYLESLIDYRGKTPEKTQDGIFLVTARNIKNGKIDYSISQEFVDPIEYDEVMHRGKPKLGEVLFTTEAPLGEVANIDDVNIALAQRVIKISGKKNVLNNFYLKYWLQNKNFQDHLQSLATGSTALGIKSSRLFELRTLLPGYEEQQTIAKFLDYKTAQIDSLIEKKEQLLKLLEEKRIALITNAVTGKIIPPGGGGRPGGPKGPVGGFVVGTDVVVGTGVVAKVVADAELAKEKDFAAAAEVTATKEIKYKPSGITWLGEIPEDWEVKRLRFVTSLNPSVTLPSDLDILVSFLPMEKVLENGGIILDTDKVYDEVKKGYTSFCDNDVIIAKITPCFENGKGSFVTGLTNGIAFGTTELHVLRSSKLIFPEYLFFITISYPFRNYGEAEMYGAGGQKRVPEEFMKDFIIPVPPIIKQTKIVKLIKQELYKIDKLSSKVTEAIEKLKEYRTSLITSAVTGKIDLRNWQHPATDAQGVN